MSSNNESGPFRSLFGFIGLFAGGAAGFEVSGGIGLLVGAVVLSGIGAWIGGLVDVVVAYLIFVAVAIAAFLINAAIRQFVFNLIAGILAGLAPQQEPSTADNGLSQPPAPLVVYI